MCEKFVGVTIGQTKHTVLVDEKQDSYCGCKNTSFPFLPFQKFGPPTIRTKKLDYQVLARLNVQ